MPDDPNTGEVEGVSPPWYETELGVFKKRKHTQQDFDVHDLVRYVGDGPLVGHTGTVAGFDGGHVCVMFGLARVMALPDELVLLERTARESFRCQGCKRLLDGVPEFVLCSVTRDADWKVCSWTCVGILAEKVIAGQHEDEREGRE